MSDDNIRCDCGKFVKAQLCVGQGGEQYYEYFCNSCKQRGRVDN